LGFRCPDLNLKNGGRSVSFTLHDAAIEAFDEKMQREVRVASNRPG
jgi:hypothetical protein